MDKTTDEFVYGGLPSEREDEYYARCRFDTAEEAYDFLQEWKVRELQRYADWKAGKTQAL